MTELEGELIVQTEPQPVCIVVPVYHWIPAAFMTNLFAETFNALYAGVEFDGSPYFVRGPYVAQSMRLAVRDMLEQRKRWKRFLVIEQDMLLPHSAILKHALHTDPIVGSWYHQHQPPYELNAMLTHPEKGTAHFSPEGVKHMAEHPALYECDVVGLGATSISREVLESWPADVPIFRNDYEAKTSDDNFTLGEVSHDVWFCQRARELEHQIYIDSSIQCRHLTEAWTDLLHYAAAHEQPTSPIVLPNRQQRRALTRVK